MCRNMGCRPCKESKTLCPSTRNFEKGLILLNEKLNITTEGDSSGAYILKRKSNDLGPQKLLK